MALPEHVHSITKPNGRRYLYFSKFRRTDREWPRVRITAEPLTEEFARPIAQLPRLEAVKSESGAWAWSLLDAIDRKREVPSPDDVAAFWTAVDKAEETGRMLLAGDRKTWRALVARFKDGDAYSALSESMRSQYNRCIKVIEAAWGDDPVRQLRAPDIQQVLDTAYKGTPQAGRVFRATLSVLFEFGIPRDFCDSNPRYLAPCAGQSKAAQRSRLRTFLANRSLGPDARTASFDARVSVSIHVSQMVQASSRARRLHARC